MKKSALSTLALLAALTSLAACQPETPMEVAKSALDPEWLAIEYDEPRDGAESFVVVIGENHASVEAQVHLSELLEALLDGSHIEAILVEGTDGEIESQDLYRQLQREFADDALHSFWRQELVEGRLAGYEYVALTRPEVKVHGIEDMQAKHRYEITMLGLTGKAFSQLADSLSLGAARLDEAVAALGRGDEAAGPALRTEVAGYREAVGRFVAKSSAARESSAPVTDLQLEILRHSFEGQQALERIGLEGLAEMQELYQTHEAEFEEYNRLVEERHALARRALTLDPGQVEALAAKIHEKEARLEVLDRVLRPVQERLQIFEREHGRDLERLGAAEKEVARLTQELEALSERARQPLEEVDSAFEAAQDAYFRLANRIEDEARRLWGAGLEGAPAETAEALKAVDRFFIEDAERLEEESNRDAKEELAERDERMVDKTKDYLDSSEVRRVALIVGYAHLPGIVERLREENLAFFGGALQPDETRAPWEEEAWERRRQPAASVFSKPETIKELSRLRDLTWRKEQLERLRLLTSLEAGRPLRPPTLTSGSGSLYEGLGEGRSALLVGELVPDHRAGRGEHILARGVVPGGGQRWEVWDRDLLRRQVTDLSGPDAELVYLYRTVEENRPAYRVVTPHGEVPLADRTRRAPTRGGGGPDYVIAVVEPDAQREGQRVVEPGWEALRGGGGGGGGRKPPSEPPAGLPEPDSSGRGEGGRRGDSGSGAAGGGTRPPGGDGWAGWFYGEGPRRGGRRAVVRTVDPRRAFRNVRFIRRQKPLEAREVAFVEEPRALADMRFTPTSGEHAGVVVFLARNVAEFREAVGEAGRARKLTNKQVALITCGDVWTENAALREQLLSAGALMVWTPDRQITPEAGRRLMDQIRATARAGQAEGRSFRDMNELVHESIRDLDPGPDTLDLRESTTWVRRLPAESTVLTGPNAPGDSYARRARG